MNRPLLALGIIHLLASPCVAGPGEIRPLPPGWVYPALPVAYEGKTLSELGPIKSIEVMDKELPGLARPSPVSNELVRKLVFELLLAHPATYAMLDTEYAKIIEVTFVDGTRFRSYGTVGQYIFAPNQPRVTCLLLPEENYRRDRIPVPASFGWGVWVSLKKENFEIYRKHFDSDAIGPFFGWLSTAIEHFAETTLSLPTTAKFVGGGARPRIFVNECDHQLRLDQRTGITLEAAWRIVHHYTGEG